MTSIASLIKAVLWTVSVALTLFIAAMSVSPQAAAANVSKWLTLVGLQSTSGWFALHAAHRVHFSSDTVMRTMSSAKCAAPCAHPATSGPSFDVPDVVLMAIAAIVTAVIVIWLMSWRRTASLRPI